MKENANMIPENPYILLSYVNTKLRDVYNDLASFCEGEDVLFKEIADKLSSIGYFYDEQNNQFQKSNF